MNPIGSGIYYYSLSTIEEQKKSQPSIDEGTFMTQVIQANSRLTELGFLKLKQDAFSYDMNDYSEMEIAILSGNKDLFLKTYCSSSFSKAFLIAFFFNQSNILQYLFEQGSRDQQSYMLECLFYTKDFDVRSFVLARIDYAAQLPEQEAQVIFDQYLPFLAKVEFLDNFDKSEDSEKLKTLYNSLPSLMTFCILWNRSPANIRNFRDPNGDGWIHHVISTKNPDLILHLLNTGESIKFCSRFRITPLKLAKMVLDDVQYKGILDELVKRDEGFTNQIEQFTLLGHRIKLFSQPLFGFDDGISKLDSFQLADSIIHSIRRFSSISSKEVFSDDRLDPVVASLFSVKEKGVPLLLDRAKENWTIVQSGWYGHFVSYLLFTPDDPEKENAENFCVKINTSSKFFSGLRFYQVGNISRADLQKGIQTAIYHSFNFVSREEGEGYFENGITTQLKLRKITKIKFKQDENNCSWAALKASFLGLMILNAMATHGSSLTKASIKSAFSEVKEDYASWEEWDLLQSVFQLDALLKENPELFQREQIYSHMISKCLNLNLETPILAIVNLAPEFLNIQDSKGKTLIMHAYEKKMETLFAFLLKANADKRLSSN